MSQQKQIDCLIESDDDDLSLGRDWAKVEENVTNNGFRMGLEASQEQILQSGFNSGFKDALRMALAGGKLDGEICARLTNPSMDQGSAATREKKTLSASGEAASNPNELMLHKILTANSELIGEIPAFLGPSLAERLSSFSTVMETLPGQKDSTSQAPDLSVKKISKCENSQGQGGDSKDASTCEAVCNNQSTFWSQLESFKAQTNSTDFVLPS